MKKSLIRNTVMARAAVSEVRQKEAWIEALLRLIGWDKRVSVITRYFHSSVFGVRRYLCDLLRSVGRIQGQSGSAINSSTGIGDDKRRQTELKKTE
jgi:hypothetical protein